MVVTRSRKRSHKEVVEEEINNNESLSSTSSDSSPVPSILQKLKKKTSLKLKKKSKKPKTIFEEIDLRDRFKAIEDSKNKENEINKKNIISNPKNKTISNIELNDNNTVDNETQKIDENEIIKEKEIQQKVINEKQLNKRRKREKEKNVNKQDNYRRALLKKQIFKSRVVDTFKPFNIADSPVLKRTVDLRNTMVRRSSMNLRGKRKSSAYGGLCPPPLPNTRSSSFYRFIAFEQPEPIKMKQLLLWCAERTMQEQNDENINDTNKNKQSNNSNEKDIPKSILNKAKEIQEEILQKLMCNKIETSWYNREKSPDEEECLKGKNKINIDNEKKLIEFQEKLEKLRKEKNEWALNYEYYKQKHEEFIKRDSNKPIIIDSNIVNIDTLMASVSEEEFNKVNMLLSRNNKLENEKALPIEEVEHILIPQIEDSLHHLIELKNSSQDICENVNNKITKAYQESAQSASSINKSNLSKINYSGKEIIDPQNLLRAISSIL